MAIIPLGALTIPSIRKLLINKPGLPGGRFSGEPPPLVSLPRSGAKGSRRTIFSRVATGRIAGATTDVGTSGFVAVTNLDLGEFALEPGAAPGALLLEVATGLTTAVPTTGFATEVFAGAGFVAGTAPDTVFAAEPVVGLPVAADLATGFVALEALSAGLVVAAEPLAGLAAGFAVGPATGFGAAANAGLAAGAAGFAAEVAAGAGFAAEGVAEAGFGVCAFGVAGPAGVACVAGAAFAGAGLAGPGWLDCLASGVAGVCCAITGTTNAPRQNTAKQLVELAFRIILFRSRIFNSTLPFI